MPATESTWRNQQTLHRIFAVTGVVLTISTLWMFWKDHARSWKTYQVTVNNIDLKMNKLRQEQFDTGEAVLEHGQRASELAAAKALPLPADALTQFKTLGADLDNLLAKWRKHGHPYSTVGVDLKRIDREAQEVDKLAATAQQARAEALAAEKALATAEASAASATDRQAKESDYQGKNQTATRAEEAAANSRASLVAYLQEVVRQAKTREDKALGLRKFQSANIDKAPMAPRVPRKGSDNPIAKLAAIQAEMLKDSRWVGDQFTETARAMHCGEIESAQVHGNATLEQAKSLADDGIPIAPLPLPVTPPSQVN